MRKAIQQLTDLLYPAYCLHCETKLMATEVHVCLSCYQKGLHTVDQNLHNKIGVETAFQEIHVLMNYWKEGVANSLMTGLKYQGKQSIGTYLGQRLGDKISRSSSETFDCLIPIPLHKKKRKFRGYNQAEKIAEGISAKTGIPVNNQIVNQPIPTNSQTNKGRKSRLEDRLETYRIDPSVNLEGKHVLIVDDVLTTGSTIEACAKALLPLNPTKISIAAICETKW